MLTFAKRSLFALLLIASSVFAQPPSDPAVLKMLAGAAQNSAAAIDEPNIDIIVETSMGNMVISLYPKKAPKTVENFLAYVDDGYFDNTIFHRVMPGFVIQGGGFTANLEKKETRPPVINESRNKLANLRGTLSMARTPNPDSATSQFFINLEDNPSLDATYDGHGYAVFGKVSEGLPIVDMISRVKTGDIKQHKNVPLDPVLILSARRKIDSLE